MSQNIMFATTAMPCDSDNSEYYPAGCTDAWQNACVTWTSRGTLIDVGLDLSGHCRKRIRASPIGFLVSTVPASLPESTFGRFDLVLAVYSIATN
jgi:hypothetical protein